jgi:anti-sigma28 factor (negative regulator of flagellin synthesis)
MLIRSWDVRVRAMCEQDSRELGILDAAPIKDRIRNFDNRAGEVRLEKIEKLRAAIADKTYYVSVPDVARKVIDHMQRPLK